MSPTGVIYAVNSSRPSTELCHLWDTKRDPESVKESAQKNGMVDGLESAVKSSMTSTTTQPRSTAHRMSLWSLNQRRLGRVILPVCRLKLVV